MQLEAIGLLLILVSAAAAQEARPDFSGTWKYAPSPYAKNCEIDRIQHREPEFAISEAVGRADVIYTLTYRTDGAEPKAADGYKRIVRMAHWEQNTLMLDAHFIGGVDFTDKHEELSLSEDGKTMTKKVHFIGAKAKPDQVIEFKKVSDGISGIAIGDSEATARHEWGEPTSIERRGNQTVYIYNQESGPFEWIFIDGKAVDGMFRKFDKAATDPLP